MTPVEQQILNELSEHRKEYASDMRETRQVQRGQAKDISRLQVDYATLAAREPVPVSTPDATPSRSNLARGSAAAVGGGGLAIGAWELIDLVKSWL